ncbi:MAG: hypothetical protein EZS28_005914, partial [Streblomastix strix]
DKVLCFNPGNMTDNRELIIDYQYTNPDTAYIEVPFSDRNPYRPGTTITDASFLTIPTEGFENLKTNLLLNGSEISCKPIGYHHTYYQYAPFGYTIKAQYDVDVAPNITYILKNHPIKQIFTYPPSYGRPDSQNDIQAMTCSNIEDKYIFYVLHKFGVVGTDCIPNTGIPVSATECSEPEGKYEKYLEGFSQAWFFGGNDAAKEALIKFGPIQFMPYSGVIIGWEGDNWVIASESTYDFRYVLDTIPIDPKMTDEVGLVYAIASQQYLAGYERSIFTYFNSLQQSTFSCQISNPHPHTQSSPFIETVYLVLMGSVNQIIRLWKDQSNNIVNSILYKQHVIYRSNQRMLIESFGYLAKDWSRRFDKTRHLGRMSNRTIQMKVFESLIYSEQQQKVIKEVKTEQLQWINPIPARSKRGKWRQKKIMDCSERNKHRNSYDFKMNDIQTQRQLARHQDWAIKIDLESAYNHVLVSSNLFKYLGFQFKDKFYIYRVMCFGIKNASLVFHKRLKPLMQHIRTSHQIRCLSYSDDLVFLNNSKENFQQQIPRFQRSKRTLAGRSQKKNHFQHHNNRQNFLIGKRTQATINQQ